MTDGSGPALIKEYITFCWIIKVRLISARLQLWAPEVSLIHLENAALQLRKICESYAKLSMHIAQLNGKKIDPKIAREYKVGKILKLLHKQRLLTLPKKIRFSKGDPENGSEITRVEYDDNADEIAYDLIVETWNKTGKVLHEFMSGSYWPETAEEAASELLSSLNAMRYVHQTIWNLIWQHQIMLDGGRIFIVSLGNCENAERPHTIGTEDITTHLTDIKFNVDYISDFKSPIDWNKIDEVAVKFKNK